LREYSCTKSESFAQIRTTVTKLQYFVGDCFLLVYPVYRCVAYSSCTAVCSVKFCCIWYSILLGSFYGAIAVPSVTRSLLLSLWTSILQCHLPGVATVARRLRYSYSWLRLILVVVSTVATPGEWQCKIRTGSMRRLAEANGPTFFKCFLYLIFSLAVNFCVVSCVSKVFTCKEMPPICHQILTEYN